MKKTILVFVLTLALALSFAGCGKSGTADVTAPAGTGDPAAQQQAPEAAAAEEDGQNPVMNVVGVYSNDSSVEALVEAEGMENAKITVTYAGSPWFQNRTVMSGPFDPETLTVTFNNATLTDYTYGSDGSVTSETVSYTDGTGHAVFNPADNTLTVTEDFPSGSMDSVYKWGPSPDMKTVTDPDHYAPVTAMDKFQLETVVAFNVRTWYVSENWFAMADVIRYPIMVNGVELADPEAFLDYMVNKTVSESDRDAMLEEDLLDMFVNGEGICMGDGEVWMNDPNYMTDAEPVLQVIALNGIVDRPET